MAHGIHQSITFELIQDLCGMTFASRGLQYYRDGRVTDFSYDSDSDRYSAIVRGSGRNKYEVEIYYISEDGGMDAYCSCPVVEYEGCKHVAAVLFRLMEHQLLERPGVHPRVASPQAYPWGQFLSALSAIRRSPMPAGPGTALLGVDYVLHISKPYSHLPGKLSIELKLGPERRYVVQQIKPFLQKMSRGDPHTFSKHFTYDASRYMWKAVDRGILEALMECVMEENEQGFAAMNTGKTLPLPPLVFERLLPALLEADSYVFHDGRLTKLREAEADASALLRFSLAADENGGGCVFRSEGFERWTFLERYGIAVSGNGEFVRAERSKLRAMQQLKQICGRWDYGPIALPAEQLQPFLQQYGEMLGELGTIQLEQQLRERVVYRSLRTKLYLELAEEGLAARVEFWYGDARFTPFGSASGTDGASIVIRDERREEQLLHALSSYGFVPADGERFRLSEEEAVFDFLYRGVPELETLADVYATPAVRSLVRPRAYRPKVRVDLDEKTDWLTIRFEVDGLDEAEVRQVMQAVQEKRTYVRLSSGSFVALDTEEYRSVSDTLEQVSVRRDEWTSPSLRRPKAHGLLLEPLRDKHANIEFGKALRTLLHHLSEPDQTPFEPPTAVAPVLRDYQRYGFQWMKTLAMYGFGGILADEMGLGKTLQAIAFLLSEQERGGDAAEPSLVVAPSSLLYNWRNELRRFAPTLRVVVLAGSKQARAELLAEAADAHVLVTSYPLLRRDIDAYAGLPLRTLILDEAQTIKNEASLTAQAVGLLQAKHRFALTGTPIENSTDELRSIADAVFPGLFPNKTAFHTLSREAISRRIKPFLLRRLKRDVLTELPEKIETLDVSEMTPPQKTLYLGYWQKLQAEAEQSLREDGFQHSRMKILAGLTRLRQLCCHPSLFLEGYAGGSGKLEQLLQVLEECRGGGKRVLLFSQFTEMLKLILRETEARGWSSFYLDGSTPSQDRVDLCDRFNAGERDLFLVSLRAGGTGLNLTGADTVILYDLWWNPAVEDQAADRAHRLGQKHVVHVIRLIAQGTVEEKMYELQQRKREMIRDILDPDGHGGGAAALTEQDIRELLQI